jgi:putative ABC transport system permease protein
MFRNYLVTALRNIVRYKFHAAVNIGGLALGLACVIFIILFVRDEISYDRWIPGTENLYRLEITGYIPDRPPLAMAVVPFALGPAMKAEIAGVIDQTHFFQEGMTLTVADRQFFEQVSVVDPHFFTLVRLPLLVGDPATVFRQPNSAVLSEAGARKYFGDANPVGRTLSTGRGDCAGDDAACQAMLMSLTVTGVMRDLPHNTQLTGDVFIPNTSAADRQTRDAKED